MEIVQKYKSKLRWCMTKFNTKNETLCPMSHGMIYWGDKWFNGVRNRRIRSLLFTKPKKDFIVWQFITICSKCFKFYFNYGSIIVFRKFFSIFSYFSVKIFLWFYSFRQNIDKILLCHDKKYLLMEIGKC